MKGEKVYNILGAVENSTIGLKNLVVAILKSGYGASMSKIMYNLENSGGGNDFFDRKEVKDLYSLMSYLYKDGLIEREKTGKLIGLKITQKGKNKLKKLRSVFGLREDYKEKKTEKGIILVIFDIPEKHRGKRDWLRNNLRALDLQLIQKSVWMGEKPLPELFINQLKQLDIHRYVDIFEISKLGSLRRLL